MICSMSRWFKGRPKPAAEEDPEWTARSAELQRDAAQRQQLLIGREAFVAELEVLLFQQDPLGINYDTNTDEYRPEAETITIRLPEAADGDDAQRIIHEEFVRWFGTQTAGPPERYTDIAKATWQNWSSFTT